MPYFNEKIKPLLLSNKNILVVFHGNSCRALLMEILKISKNKIIEFEIPTGNPLLIRFEKDLAVKDYKYLDNINFPSDIKKLSVNELQKLSEEVRTELIDAVSETGGHLGAGLGVVELTVALHYIFNTPNDKLIWDVGHQTYPHKILTGRKDRIRTLRQGKGLSGFTKRSESEFDPFGAAHSSTSISSALGIAFANKLSNKSDNVIAVIGDGALTGGMALEAINHAGHLPNTSLIVSRCKSILTDEASNTFNIKSDSSISISVERKEAIKS